MSDKKRKARSYKVIDKYYDAAMKKAKKQNTTLAELIERFVMVFSEKK